MGGFGFLFEVELGFDYYKYIKVGMFMEENLSDFFKYNSIGKTYNNEKGIISLTSWKARINTVSKTIFSLIKQCPGFHIVLVLSEEEFPNKESELPDDLMLFVNSNLIEIFWIYQNYKAFKKILFTLDKYRDVPVISADDDCIYTCNYAEQLYKEWERNKNSIIRFPKFAKRNNYVAGPYTLYPTYNYFRKYFEGMMEQLSPKLIKLSFDDDFYNKIIKANKLSVKSLNRSYIPAKFIRQECAIHKNFKL